MRSRGPMLGFILCLAGAAELRAQEEASPDDGRPWSNTADLSAVLTGGNSEATSISVSNKFTYDWRRSQVTVTLSGLRSKTVERGEPELVAGQIRVPENEATAEAYSANTRYRYRLSDGVLAYGGGGWERDRRAGIDDRFTGVLGLGYEFLGGDRESLVFEVGTDYTDENRVDGTGASYAGVQSTATYERALSETASLSAELQALENLEQTEDFRLNSTASLTAGLTRNLALKLSYTVRYDNEPVRILVDPASDAVFTFDRTDTRLGASLVVNF